MSFSGTPLGQGRRLDHRTFLNRPNPNHPPQTRPPHSPPKAERSIPASYAYGAPTLATRSPPKHLSTASHATHLDPAHDENDTDNSREDTALVRFARLKQREQTGKAADLGPRTTTSPPNPTKWSVKDTSVQIANALYQAAKPPQDMTASNPNDSWASGSRSISNVPRSTSVEYEKETQSTTVRRLAAPPSRLAPPARSTGASRQPLGKTQSVNTVPDSEEERIEDRAGTNARGKSPFESVVDMAKRTAFYLRQRSQEPEAAVPADQHANGQDGSYDYEAEEREYQTNRRANSGHKRNRMSVDNKAYRPTDSDLDDDDDDFSDGERKVRRRKSKKKDSIGGPLLTLPVTSYDKRRRRKKGPKGEGEEGDEDSGSEGRVSEQRSRQSAIRTSVPPVSRPSVSRGSIPPEHHTDFEQPIGDTSLDDAEQGLTSISEAEEENPPLLDEQEPEHTSSSLFSVGGLLGRMVNIGYRLVTGTIGFFFQCILFVLGMVGRAFGMIVNVLFNRPARFIMRTNPGPIITLLKYVVAAAVVYVAWLAIQDRDLSNFIPSLHLPARSRAPYHAPDVPASDMAELSARLQALENALADLSLDSQRTKASQDLDARSRSELVGRLGALESRVQKESSRAIEAETLSRTSTGQDLQTVRKEMEALQALFKTEQQRAADRPVSDADARAKLEALEERVGSVEGGVKEALELGKTTSKVGGMAGAAWWSKLMSSSSPGLMIKSSDGQDVTALIGHLVDSSMSKHLKDGLAKPDFAMHSTGAQVIPTLTSPTLELRPDTFRMQMLGYITGNGYAIGRPPITALHHETHSGHCWPFAGSEGQLGVQLALPVYIDEVTIDHVAPEVAWDMRSAPRDMEVWGLVEGQQNIEKVREWRSEQAQRRTVARQEAEAMGLEFVEDDAEYPRTLPRSPQYVRVAKFSYDVHAPHHVQTFPVDQEIRELGVDFGVVVLRIKNNWGRKEFTCLYRLRVHGRKVEETALPALEELEAVSDS